MGGWSGRKALPQEEKTKVIRSSRCTAVEEEEESALAVVVGMECDWQSSNSLLLGVALARYRVVILHGGRVVRGAAQTPHRVTSGNLWRSSS